MVETLRFPGICPSLPFPRSMKGFLLQVAQRGYKPSLITDDMTQITGTRVIQAPVHTNNRYSLVLLALERPSVNRFDTSTKSLSSKTWTGNQRTPSRVRRSITFASCSLSLLGL